MILITKANNKRFKQQSKLLTSRTHSVFAVMCYQMGLVFLPILPQLHRSDMDTAIRFFKSRHIEGLRGKRNFGIDNKDENPSIEIEKITFQPLKPLKIIIEQSKAMPYNHSVFSDIHNLCVSGWENPYLCV